MMRKILHEERGMMSLLGICSLGILMFLSATIYAVSMSYAASTRRFLVRNESRGAAEDGVRLTLAKMNEDAETATSAEGTAEKWAPILTGASGDISFSVYARKKGDTILLLGVGEKDGENARAIGVVEKKNGKYLISQWER